MARLLRMRDLERLCTSARNGRALARVTVSVRRCAPTAACRDGGKQVLRPPAPSAARGERHAATVRKNRREWRGRRRGWGGEVYGQRCSRSRQGSGVPEGAFWTAERVGVVRELRQVPLGRRVRFARAEQGARGWLVGEARSAEAGRQASGSGSSRRSSWQRSRPAGYSPATRSSPRACSSP